MVAERRTAPFPDAYYHLPRELEGELTAAGLNVEGVYGIEGPGWLLVQPDDAIEDGVVWEQILAAARVCELDPQLAAVSAHLLAAATKPASRSRQFRCKANVRVSWKR